MKLIASPRQLGQTILWFLATLAACCALLMIVFNVGQVATEKAKTTNAADAVAMSAGLVQARGMNLMAYTNRAIIADEMTIATIASLDSWVKYNTQIATNLAKLPIPYVQPFAVYLAEAMTWLSIAVKQISGPAITGIQDWIITPLEGQNKLLHLSIPEAVREAAAQVAADNNVDLNDASLFTYIRTFGANLADNGSFFTEHSKDGSKGDDRLTASVIMKRSRDLWNANRGAGKAIDALNKWMKFLAFFTLGASPQIEKTSGSAQLTDFDHWEDQDSLDLYANGWYFDWKHGRWRPFHVPVLPLGWGRANVNHDGSPGLPWPGPQRYLCSERLAPACGLAYGNEDTFRGWKGVPEMWDLQDEKDPEWRRKKDMKIYVSVKSMAASPPRTSQQMGIDNVDVPGPQGSPRVVDGLAPSQALLNGGGSPELQAISSARVFFTRPKQGRNDPTALGVFTKQGLFRSDGVQEFGSLYNPYWQARLHTPNCNLLIDPLTTDCVARTWLYSGNPALEFAQDAVP